uniref:RNA-directed DNA polymerase n=1 Tax=Fagus sylvatica TaxID=28930 RepID=A0A2N9H4D7_FAGSY
MFQKSRQAHSCLSSEYILLHFFLQAGMAAAQDLIGENCALLSKPKHMVPSFIEAGARLFVTRFLGRYISAGCLILLEEGGTIVTLEGDRRKCSLTIVLKVLNPQFYWKVMTRADLGLADAYIDGDISFTDKNEGLLNLFMILIASRDSKSSISKLNKNRGWWTPLMFTACIGSAKYFLKHISRQNTLTQARRNISRHYELKEDEDLKVAQLRKMSILIEKAKIDKKHEVLDIGCGWGSFAIEVVKQTGCKYTGITLSKEQLNYAINKVKDAGLQTSTMVPEKTVHGSISQSPENWRRAGPPRHPVVHDGLPSGPRQITQRFTSKLSHKSNLRRRQLWQVTKKMTKKMRQGLKRPRNLPWPPKSVSAEASNDEKQAGHFLCPLVAVDFITNHHNSRATTTTAQHSGGPCSSTSWNLGSKVWSLVDQGVLEGNAPSAIKWSTALGHSHAMGETHAHGGGQTLGEENPLGGGQTLGGGQVLGGGEIPVGGPQQMALMFEMIKGMQQNQVELAESLRQLREANDNKEDHQNKNDNRNHEERESHNKNDTPFVTMSDVADLLKQERERPPKEPRHFVRRPPYPIELLKEPYPEKYDTPVFALFDGRKGSAMEHISKFLDSMGPFAAHGDLCLREFSKSLVDRAYTWYTVLPAGSIRTWEDMVESFCSKYFHVEEKITLVNLHSTKQQTGEDLVKYIHRFRDVSLDCHVKYQEGELVEVCIDNMLPEFRAHLENLDITRFAPLLQKARKTAISVKPQVEKARDKKSLPQTLTVSTATAPSGTKRKNPTDKAYEEPPPLPFTAEEMMAIFDKWVQDQVIKLPKISKQPTAEEQKDPKYCRYHRYVNHPTVDCRTLRWEVNRKIQNGTLQLSEEQQKVHQTPFPNYNKGKGKAVVSVVIHGNVSDIEAEESAAASASLVPAAVRTLQKSPKFKSLFNQLGFGPEARNAATEALITIAAESGATCFTAEAHASRAFLETTNAITFTDEDMEVQYPDHRRPLYLSAVVKDVQVRRALVDTGSCLNLIPLSTLQAANVSQQKIQGSPMEVTGFGGVTEYTMGHVQLVLKVGPIVALTRFHVVNAETPYHVLLAALYDDLASTGEPSIVRPCGTPLPAWEDIKDDPEIDLRELLERKKKRKEREVEQGSATTMRACPTPRWTHCLSLMKTENSGKVVVDQLQSTAMSSEEVTVDHAQSTTESMAINSERPAVDQTESTAMNSKEARIKQVDQTDVFAWDYHEMPGIDPGLVAHSLNVEPGTRPVVQPMRTFHTEVEAQITQEVKKLLAAGFIKPIQHPRWLSNIVPVKKKNGQIRCCVDFRNLNKACPKDEFPLPNMDLLIDSAAGHAMFSFMDGFSGYNQIRMSTRDAEKTAFRTPIGNFYYTVMPFGLKNAGATYQRTMTAMFHDMMHKEIEDYVDDIVVKSKKREDHLRILRKVFDRCRLYKLKMNPLKCAFGVSAGKFLGFLVHNRGIDVDPAKASAIATMKAPTSHKELKSFLGRLSYIRRFIPGLAAVTAVFTPLMKKGVPFVWSTACQQAFEKIQLIMTKLPTVCAPVPGRPLRLYLASNSEAIGGLVAQEDEDGTEKPIYYVSRALRDAETRYSGAERACLALIYASQRLRHYFLAHKIQLMTKSHPIRSLLHRPILSGRLAQWLLQLSQYEIITETPTAIKSQAIADLLAQFPGEDSSSISHEVPGEIGEVLLAGLVDSTWTLKFDGSSTSNSSGAGIVLMREDGETIAKSFKLDFSCSNNASEYEAYITGLAIAHEMGIKHLRVIGDSNLIICQTKGSKVDVTIDKRSMPITDLLREKFKEQNLDAEDWRTPIKAKLMSPEGVADLKVLKDYVLIAGDLYRRLPGGVLARCVNLQEAAKKLIEVHEKCCEFRDGATRYFVEGGILFRKGFHGDPLRCLSLAESQTVMKEAHSGECGEHQGKKRLYQLLLTLGYYWPTMKKDTADFVKSCHTCQLQANLIHTHPTSLQNMATPWPFHTWGLDLIGPINPSSGGYIWILGGHRVLLKQEWQTLESLEEARELAQVRSLRYHQKLADAYEKTLQTRIFAKGQMVLRTVDHVRRGLPSPSKFAPNWEGPYLIREAYDSGYYKLSTADGTTLVDPINGKWLKRYYS